MATRSTFDFYGTGLTLRIQGGPYWAYLRVTVDGQHASALPCDEAGRAYLVLHDPLGETRVVPVAQGLPLGRHEVQIEAVGGWGQWPFRGVVVLSEERRSLPWGAWAGLIALVTLAWLALAWPWLPVAARWLVERCEALTALPEPITWVIAIGLGLCLAFSRWFALDLAALAGLGVLFLARPDAALPLIAAAIPFWPQPKALPVGQFSLYEMLVWVAVAARVGYWVAASAPKMRSWGTLDCRLRRDDKPEACVTCLDVAILALLVAGLAATLAAERYGVAVREFRTVFLAGALFYWLISRMPARPGRGFVAGPLVAGLLAGAGAVSLLGLWQLVSGQGRIDVEGVWRVRALYGSPNNLALLLVRIVPLAVALAAFGAKGSRALRFWLWAAALVTAAACVATFSKGALLLGLPVGLTGVLVGGAWRARRRWPLLLLALLAAAGLMALLALFRTPRFADLLNLESGTTFIRLKLWLAAWSMTLDHPWLGVGPDNFLYAYRTHYVLPSAWQELNLSHPHNIFLDLWTRLGLIGVLAGGWALLTSLRRGWQIFRRGADRAWPLALGLLAGLVATVAHGLIDNSLFLVDLMALFMLAAGVLRRLN